MLFYAARAYIIKLIKLRKCSLLGLLIEIQIHMLQ